jgi:hypothetical protein
MTALDSPLFQFKQGDHICVFHRREDSLMDVLSPYIAEGLRKGERCFCVQQPHIVKRLEYDLRFIGVDFDKAVKSGALEFHRIEDAYLPNGVFDPAKMMDLLIETIEDSVKKGFSGFRSAGDLSWATDGPEQCRQLLGYEAMVEECFPGKPATGMCQYPVESFSPRVLDRVWRLHRQMMVDPQVPSSHASLSLNLGRCACEIVTDKFMIDPKYYYVVEEQEKHEVMGWGTAHNFDVASLRAEHIARRKVAREYFN